MWGALGKSAKLKMCDKIAAKLGHTIPPVNCKWIYLTYRKKGNYFIDTRDSFFMGNFTAA